MSEHTPTLEERHAQWREAQEADGWRYGPAVYPEARKHPLIRPWAELTDDEREAFRQTVEPSANSEVSP